jgi:uncharacterized protein (DUF608 family)
MKPVSFRYSGKNLLQIALPMGGIGAGTICLNGQGGIQDFAVRHKPEFTAEPDTHATREGAFALLHLPESKVTRLVEGPMPPERIYDQGLHSMGYRKGGHEGFPRFRNNTFEGEYPFGHVQLSDPKIPLEVRVTGFNPFIPLDDKNSGLPCAILEYALRNTSRKPVKYEFSYHLSHLATGPKEKERDFPNTVIPGRGVLFSNSEAPGSEKFGTACLLALSGRPLIKGMWFRGGWYDSLSALWQEISTGKFQPNEGSNGVDIDWGWPQRGGSILFRGKVNPGQTATHALVIAWHFPNSNLTAGGVRDAAKADPSSSAGEPSPAWRPYYAGVWKDAGEVAEYVRTHYASLRRRTLAFKDALFGSTVPRQVIEAVSANLGILKSPTVLRQESGVLWGWEGCGTGWGSCHGSCTHVWNYAQAFCHLFPPLERTLREQELLRSMDKRGHVNFRSALPDGPAPHDHHAAADGQLGGILKLYRDWQISGDTAWMKSLYPKARLSLEYGIATWDPDRRGALFEPHHNTYDIEFWGPDGMCGSIYIGALSAMSLMAAALGEKADEKAYRELAEKGARFMDEELFNGEYYQQKVLYQDLRDQSFMKLIAGVTEKSDEALKLLKHEGPKYQYGSGCLADGIIGGWMAHLYGVETPLDRKKIRSTLTAIYRHNLKQDLFEHACCQRPGYAIANEAGLLLCSWPRGGKPTLPFIYSDEVWTGIEYQVASHLILEGLVKEGLAIVKAARSRYDGHIRNPWNEYECGNYYARAMASYALLPSIAGFRYSAVTKTLVLEPRLQTRPFRTFFSTATAWGTLTLDKTSLIVTVLEGRLELEQIRVKPGPKSVEMPVRAVIRGGHSRKIKLGKA